MLISFWSGADIRAGVTTNAACVAYYYARRYMGKVALFENHVPTEQSLEDVLIGRKQFPFLFEEPSYYSKMDSISYIYGLMKSGMPISSFSDASIHLADDKLHYLPLPSRNQDLFDYEFNKIIETLLNELSSKYEVVFADLKKFQTMTTKKIIEKSDYIFLNLAQDDINLESFLKNYSLDYKKLFFIVGRFKEKDEMNFNKFIRKYDIDEARSSYIPYKKELSPVYNNGNLTKFLNKYFWTIKGDKNFDLISQLRKITEFIKNNVMQAEENYMKALKGNCANVF